MNKKSQSTVDRLRQRINEQIEEELAKQLRNIPTIVEKAVQGAILSILGVTKRDRCYEVDTFGRNPLHRYIQTTVSTALELHVGPMVTAELEHLMKLKTLPRSIATQTARNAEHLFVTTFKRVLGAKFEELAENYALRINEELKKAVEGISVFNEDLFDPNSYEGKIGEVFLEEIAKQLAND